MSKDVVYAHNTEGGCKNAFVSREVVISNSLPVDRDKSHFIRSLPRPCKMQKVSAKSVTPLANGLRGICNRIPGNDAICFCAVQLLNQLLHSAHSLIHRLTCCRPSTAK